MEYMRNSFGDIKITYDETKELPSIVDEHHTILVGADLGFYNERVPYLIGHTQSHGYIFGNEYAHKTFPYLANSLALGGCVVAFANVKMHDEEKVKTYALVVKIKNRNYLMNPAGFMQKSDGSLREASMREFAEETGCELINWKPCAQWIFTMKFAGLDLIGHTTAGFGFIRHCAENHWKEVLANGLPVCCIPIENEETESVIFIDVMHLDRVQELEDQKLLPCKLSGHHFNMILEEALKRNLVPASFADLRKDTSYLLAFENIQ